MFNLRNQGPHDLDADGWSPLHHACDTSSYSIRALKAARELIPMTDASIINKRTTGRRPTGYTTLHLVCDSSDKAYGRHGLVEDLVSSRAELEATDPRGNTALLLAAGVGVTDVVGALLTAGAEVGAINLNGMGAKQKALGHSSDVINLLNNAHAPDTYAPHTGRTWGQMCDQRKARLALRTAARRAPAFQDPHGTWRPEGWQVPHCPDRWHRWGRW